MNILHVTDCQVNIEGKRGKRVIFKNRIIGKQNINQFRFRSQKNCFVKKINQIAEWNRPVPPATIIIFPGWSYPKCRPYPLAQLNWKEELSWFSSIRDFVNYPFSYFFIIRVNIFLDELDSSDIREEYTTLGFGGIILTIFWLNILFMS